MEGPAVKNTLIADNGVRWHIFAYRILSRNERIIEATKALAKFPKSKRPKRGTSVTILTGIGRTP